MSEQDFQAGYQAGYHDAMSEKQKSGSLAGAEYWFEQYLKTGQTADALPDPLKETD